MLHLYSKSEKVGFSLATSLSRGSKQGASGLVIVQRLHSRAWIKLGVAVRPVLGGLQI
jgi:hypothetical protein